MSHGCYSVKQIEVLKQSHWKNSRWYSLVFPPSLVKFYRIDRWLKIDNGINGIWHADEINLNLKNELDFLVKGFWIRNAFEVERACYKQQQQQQQHQQQQQQQQQKRQQQQQQKEELFLATRPSTWTKFDFCFWFFWENKKEAKVNL